MKNREKIKKIFRQLLSHYEEAGFRCMNFERVKSTLESMEREDGFFSEDPIKQVKRLLFLKEVHTGRGEMVYSFGKVDADFWDEFDETIDLYCSNFSREFPSPFPF